MASLLLGVDCDLLHCMDFLQCFHSFILIIRSDRLKFGWFLTISRQVQSSQLLTSMRNNSSVCIRNVHILY